MDIFGLKGLMLGTLLKCVLINRGRTNDKLEINVKDLYSSKPSQNIEITIKVNKVQMQEIYVLDREITGHPVKQDVTLNSLITAFYSQLIDGEWTLNSESGALRILSYSEAGSKIAKYVLNNKLSSDQYIKILTMLKNNISDPNIAKCRTYVGGGGR